jgi:hypothetical protein
MRIGSGVPHKCLGKRVLQHFEDRFKGPDSPTLLGYRVGRGMPLWLSPMAGHSQYSVWLVPQVPQVPLLFEK